MVTFDRVKCVYPDGTIGLEDVSFSLKEGSFTGILGPSGAGKSTILMNIIGEMAPVSGTVTCMNVHPSELTGSKLSRYRRKIGYISQNLLLLNDRSVFENVNVILRGTGSTQKAAELRAHNVLEIVGLRDRMKAMPHQLSGGEQQRIAIARALALTPKLLIADEPTGNLDPQKSEEIMELFSRINDVGITVIVVTHEWELIRSKGATCIYLQGGRLSRFPAGGKNNVD